MSGLSPLHRRDHRSVLTSLEKRVLIWLALRLPGLYAPGFVLVGSGMDGSA